MVRQICTSGAGIDVVEGIAGSGKTFALAAAHDAWTASGYQVRGACLAARAARRLEEGSGIPSTTLDRLQRNLASDPLRPTDVVVVDEGGMVSTRSLLRLVEQAQAARAKVVLVGDPRQLPELKAGGAFAALIERHGHAKLETNRRQSEPWEQDALTQLRTGDPDRAFDQYLGHDRIHHGEGEDLRTRLVSDWHAARRAGADTLMVATNLRAVDDLNDRARHLLQRDQRRVELHDGLSDGSTGTLVEERHPGCRDEPSPSDRSPEPTTSAPLHRRTARSGAQQRHRQDRHLATPKSVSRPRERRQHPRHPRCTSP